MMRRLGFLTATLLLAWPASAQSPADVERARAHFDVAEAHFQSGEYAQAVAEYQRAYDLMEGHPNRALVLYNLGRANEELGRTNAAIESFRRFLTTASQDAPYRDLAERRLRELELRAELEGSVTPNDDLPDTTADVGGGVSPIAIALLSAGGAALLAGVVTGSIALTEDAAVADGCDDAGRCPPDSRPRAEQAQALANATDALLFGGGAIALTGIVLLFVLEDGSTDDTRASVACSPTSCVAALRGSF